MSRIDGLKSIYFPKEINVDKEIFAPIAQHSTSLDCMVGYFTSGSLEELAESISCYLRISAEHKMRFIVSPHLEKADLASIKTALNTDRNLLPLLFPGYELSEKSLRSDCLNALCYLVSSGKLILRVALQSEGLFHSKCWLFKTEQGDVAVHGSSNATQGGLKKNFEQISVSREWRGDEPAETCTELRDRFETIWSNKYSGISCSEITSATIDAITTVAEKIRDKFEDADIPELLLSALNADHNDGIGKEQILKVPDWLNYSEGPYAHQGRAISAWVQNGKNGILAIATGGGKTLTSLVAASLLNRETGSLFVVIAVPTKPLMDQWAEDVNKFNVTPVNSYNKSKSIVKREVKQALRRIRHGASRSEVIIVTHKALKSDLLDLVAEFSEQVPTLLIADEVHNLGSVGFKANPPYYFKNRIGLSATHDRQFDQEGTEFLVRFFGGVVFEYNLEEAIGECLVPYEYYIHEVFLTAEEEEQFCELTYEIRKLSYAADYEESSSIKQRWKTLCLARRRLIEAASNKVLELDRLLPASKYSIEKSLIFCTDKYPDQILAVNALLDSRSVNYHQVTQEETSNPRLLAKIMKDFTLGKMQVLTSKRVLDEGFNVPQVEIAYLVASNTVRRQWIQRLGRVLRMSASTGKTKAVIHDFVVLPPSIEGAMDEELEALLMSEYDRLSFFSNLSVNGLEEGGAMYLASKILNIVRKK
jgi:superfamily II DNA or RNA helicase